MNNYFSIALLLVSLVGTQCANNPSSTDSPRNNDGKLTAPRTQEAVVQFVPSRDGMLAVIQKVDEQSGQSSLSIAPAETTSSSPNLQTVLTGKFVTTLLPDGENRFCRGNVFDESH